MISDLRYAIRSLRNNPTFTLVAVITLALGIGANASVFGVVDTLLFRPPAYVRDPGAVKRINFRQRSESSGERTGPITSFPIYLDFAEHARSFTDLAAFTFRRSLTVGIEGQGHPVKAALVTHTFFPLLGVQPALGRFFNADEDQPGVGGVAVVSYAFWERWFGGEPQVLGKTLRIGSELYTVIGVAPPAFTGVHIQAIDLLPPMRPVNELMFCGDVLSSRQAARLRVIARLRLPVG